jgi:hypothetical protein
MAVAIEAMRGPPEVASGPALRPVFGEESSVVVATALEPRMAAVEG